MDSQPVKVLYFVDRMLRGGIQSLVIDWVSRFDKEKIKVDFLLLDDGNTYELEETLKQLGCNVYKLKGIWIRKPSDFFKMRTAMNNFFREHNDYKVVHLHSSSKNFMVLKYAKKYGIQIRIAHSHNTDFQTRNKFKKAFGNILKKSLLKYATDYFACSAMAGEFLFGKGIEKNDKFKIIHNAVDYERFKFNENIRLKKRREFGFEDNDIVIGHVGRFEFQKNHDFLIEVFKKLVDKNYKYKLLLVGKGSLEDEIKRKVKTFNIEDNVKFAGFNTDVNELMQAMDVFAFPSRYEGLGLVLVEAQATGMPCIATYGTIPKEVKINDNLDFIELNVEKWVAKIENMDVRRLDSKKNIKKSGYLIDDVIKQLTDIYGKEGS